MKTVWKYATAVALAGTLALAAATPSEARNGRNAAMIGGFAAGAVIGAAAASANNGYYYGPGYASGYAYQPGYAYEPAYAEPVYAEPVYAAPRYQYRNNYHPTCAVEMGGGRLDYSAC